MAEPIEKRATWLDVLATPEGAKAEVIGGVFLMSPRARPAHGFVQGTLAATLVPRFGGRGSGSSGGWWIVIESDVELGPHDIVSPDVVGWRRDRVPEFPYDRPIRFRPDWVCEVLSPSTARWDRIRKADLYLRAGVPHLWLIDTDSRILEAFEARAGAWVRLGAWSEGDVPEIPPFADQPIAIESLFPPAAASARLDGE